jgi:hypothetical protein
MISETLRCNVARGRTESEAARIDPRGGVAPGTGHAKDHVGRGFAAGCGRRWRGDWLQPHLYKCRTTAMVGTPHPAGLPGRWATFLASTELAQVLSLHTCAFTGKISHKSAS